MKSKWAIFSGIMMAFLMNGALAFAQAVPADSSAPAAPTAAAAAPAPQQPGGLVGMFAPIALMFGVFYFMLIRPQNKRMQEQKKMQEDLKVGDDVLLNSGFLGKITGITEKVVTVEFDGGSRAKVLRSFIHRKGQDLTAEPAV